MNDSNPLTVDVAIVGFGPAGAVAAALLGSAGVRTYVCDRSRAIYDKPRAFALDHEIMRVLQGIGVHDEIAPLTEPFTDSCWYGVDGTLIRRMSTVAPPYPLAFVPSLVFTQPPLEAALRRRVQSLPSVEVDLGAELVSLAQDDDGVALDLAGDEGRARQVRARYVIGCDGASSTVRGLVGIELSDLGFDEPWLVVDLLVNPDALHKLPDVSVQYCEPSRPTTYLIGPGNHRRWEISLNPGEDPQAMASPQATWTLLSRWLTPDDATLWRQSSYRFHALVAERWRAGRVFLAGDSAHQQPPFLGQGMCQGVRDGANLAWKLGAVLRGQAHDALLDTYGAERGGHVTELTTRIKHIGHLIGERDPARARERDARLLADCGGNVRPTPRQEVQPALRGGLFEASTHPAVGTLFPQPWIVRDGVKRRMDDIAGSGWRLCLAPGCAPGPAADVAGGFPMPLSVIDFGASQWAEADGVVRGWFERHACAAALVRPDHYVQGVAAAGGDIAGLVLRAAVAV